MSSTSKLSSMIELISDPSHVDVVRSFINNSNLEDLFEQIEGSTNNSLLHWICYNNQVDLLELFFKFDNSLFNPFSKYPALNIFFLRSGVLNATPLHWACRQGSIDIVMYIIAWVDQYCEFEEKNSVLFALFNSMDNQGFTPFTCAVLSKDDFLAFTILASCSSLDLLTKLDCDGRSVYHWMGYHGIFNMILYYAKDYGCQFKDILTVQDYQGFTPLHWAACKGHYYSVFLPFLNLLKLEMSSAEIDALFKVKNKESYSIYDYSLIHDKYLWLNRQLYPKSKYFSVLFSLFTLFAIVFGILLPWYIYIIVIPLSIFLSVHSIQHLYAGERNPSIIHQGLYLSGLVLSTGLFGVFFSVYMILGGFYLPLTTIVMIITMFFCLFKTWNKVPSIPSLTNELHIRNLLISLHSKKLLNKDHICTTCIARKPLRSKHCKELNVCVAKFDHYCPWTSSVIGHHNHTWFYTFIVVLLLCIILFITSCLLYLQETASVESIIDCLNNDTSSGLLISICNGALYHPMLLVFMGWLLINGIWTLFVFVSQSVLIMWNMTTNEQVNKHRYGYLNYKQDSDIELTEQRKHPKYYLANNRQYNEIE
eukprot:NODE_110_length_19453_cov_0.364369.p1 type:complete len:593 gc:universal NODE_110_length_19453_cov_0.364369:4703-6481(+)